MMYAVFTTPLPQNGIKTASRKDGENFIKRETKESGMKKKPNALSCSHLDFLNSIAVILLMPAGLPMPIHTSAALRLILAPLIILHSFGLDGPTSRWCLDQRKTAEDRAIVLCGLRYSNLTINQFRYCSSLDGHSQRHASFKAECLQFPQSDNIWSCLLEAFAELQNATGSLVICVSVRQHGKTRVSLD